MKYKLSIDSIWEFGQRKDDQGNPHQEDSMYPAHQQTKETDRLFILCDGMGGHAAGEVASATVCEAMSQYIQATCPDAEGDFDDSLVRNAVKNAFAALDRTALSMGVDPKAKKRMGTTMTFLKLHKQGATVAHMGDSRVYHIRQGKDQASTRVMWRTEDHSLVNDLIRLGDLTPEEAKTSNQRNVITRAMQPFSECPPKADVHRITDIRKGDFFYLCSDGMYENMTDSQLCFFFSQIVKDDERVELLRSATQENRDNHTAFIIKIEEVEGVQAPAAPQPLIGTVEVVEEAQEKSTTTQAPQSNKVVREEHREKSAETSQKMLSSAQASKQGKQQNSQPKEATPAVTVRPSSSPKNTKNKIGAYRVIIAVLLVLFMLLCVKNFWPKTSEEKGKTNKDKTEKPVKASSNSEGDASKAKATKETNKKPPVLPKKEPKEKQEESVELTEEEKKPGPAPSSQVSSGTSNKNGQTSAQAGNAAAAGNSSNQSLPGKPANVPQGSNTTNPTDASDPS